MTCIGQKWDLSRIPEKWHFTKTEAENMYKKAISNSRIKQIKQPHLKENILKRKFHSDWFYAVGFTAKEHPESDERFSFMKDLWACYGYRVHTHNGVIYVRK